MIFKLNNDEQAACWLLKGKFDSLDITKDLYKFLKDNQITAMAGHLFQNGKQQIDIDVCELLIQDHAIVNNYMSHYLEELDHIGELFTEEGIVVVALKNVGIARGIYPCAGCCPMGDMDLLVSRRDFLKAHELLVRDNYTFNFRCDLNEVSIEGAMQSGGTEYWKQLESGEKMWLELQFRSVAGRWISSLQEPDTDELILKSIVIEGSKVRLLAPEDNLLQVSLHTAKHSYVREPGIRLHTDVDRIVRFQKIDWDKFISAVKKHQVKTAVYFSLLIPSVLFATPIPLHVLKELKPGILKNKIILSLINNAGLFNPNVSKFNKLAYFLFNILLYDSFQLVLRNMFPEKKEMMELYTCESKMVKYFYIKRIYNYLLNRKRT